MSRAVVAILSVLLALTAACTGDDGPPSRAECEKATTHAIELRVAGAELPGATPDVRRRHQEQLAGAVGASLTDRCEQTFDRARLACVSKATTAAALDACEPGGAQ